jgi:hypothetical protein
MTVDGFLNGDFMDASDDEGIEDDEQVRLINPPWFSTISILFYRHKLTRIWILTRKEPWNQTTKVPLDQ